MGVLLNPKAWLIGIVSVLVLFLLGGISIVLPSAVGCYGEGQRIFFVANTGLRSLLVTKITEDSVTVKDPFGQEVSFSNGQNIIINIGSADTPSQNNDLGTISIGAGGIKTMCLNH